MEIVSQKTVASNLRRLRKERGLAQEKLAHLAGLNRNTVGKIERQECRPFVATFEKLAKALDVELAALFLPEK